MLFSFVSCIICLYGQAQTSYISPEIQSYVDFINETNTSPVDYVMELFEKYDVVILGERDHRDMTQYELIKDIISDSRFIEKVGHVMTEVGVHNMTERANQVLTTDYPNHDSFYAALLPVLRDADYTNLWEKTNFGTLLQNIYETNRGLPPQRKIKVTFTDVSFSWDQTQNYTHDDYRIFVEEWAGKYRDAIMANNAISSLYEIFDGPSERKKALIIYNRPHSYQHYERSETNYMWAARYIFERFPGRVANVMINWLESGRENPEDMLIHKGKWDAAFAVCKNKSIGFDFAGSPFGRDYFDMYTTPTRETAYKDVYTGFIFYKPIEEWVLSIGHNGFIDNEFWPEYLRREIINYGKEEDQNSAEKYANDVRIFPRFSPEEMESIRQRIAVYFTLPE